MTLGELRKQLLQIGIKQVGAMRRQYDNDAVVTCTVIFSADQKIVVPFALETVYFLAVDSLDDTAVVHSEKYKALMRAIDRDRGTNN